MGLTPSEKNLQIPTQVVLCLVKSIVNSGRNITADNYYCSVELCHELTKRGLILVGTLKKNKKKFPLNFRHPTEGQYKVVNLALLETLLLFHTFVRKTGT